jgi:cytochrome c-type biogenesis protein CcmH/NrfG
LSLVKEEPGVGTMWRGLASALAALGRHDEALESFQIASRLLPDDPAIGDRSEVVGAVAEALGRDTPPDRRG